MGIHLSDEELSALTGLPDTQVRLYIFGIRCFMDYATGIVGVKRRISYQSLSETLYVEPIRGVKTKNKLSRPQLRRAVKALERGGLIKIKSQKFQLVLECLLAKQDKFAQNKAVTRPTSLADTKAVQEEKQTKTMNARSRTVATKKTDPITNQLQFIKTDTPPGSDITLSNESVISAVKKRGHALPNNFVVKSAHLELAAKNGWPDPNHEIEAFRDHHLARGNVMKDWDRAFYTWLRNAKRFKENHYETRRRFSNRSESILRALKSNAPNVNWEISAKSADSSYGMD